eukprot:gene5725-biopygen2775
MEFEETDADRTRTGRGRGRFSQAAVVPSKVPCVKGAVPLRGTPSGTPHKTSHTPRTLPLRMGAHGPVGPHADRMGGRDASSHPPAPVTLEDGAAASVSAARWRAARLGIHAFHLLSAKVDSQPE